MKLATPLLVADRDLVRDDPVVMGEGGPEASERASRPEHVDDERGSPPAAGKPAGRRPLRVPVNTLPATTPSA
jgi:hypothetical protein